MSDAYAREEMRLPPTPAEWAAVQAERDRYRALAEKLASALDNVKLTCEIVLAGRSVIASVALSGAVDVAEEALAAARAELTGGK